MRCAIDFDEEKPLIEQNVVAWGEMQSLEDDPAYKEEDISDERDKEFFRGYKFALDDICATLANAVFDEEITQDASESIQMSLSGSLCCLLFSILDEQTLKEEEKNDD